MAITIGNLIITVTIIVILSPLLASISTEYGGSDAQFNALAVNSLHALNSSFNPINNTINKGIGNSQNLSSASSSIGFVLGFIMPGYSTIITQLIQFPNVISEYLIVMGSHIPGLTPGTQNQEPYLKSIIGFIINDMILFLAFVGWSIWSKYPAWSNTG